jgi:hypothetical protein
VAGLASDLEGNAVGGGVLELEGGGREVVEILVEEIVGRLGNVGEGGDRHDCDVWYLDNYESLKKGCDEDEDGDGGEVGVVSAAAQVMTDPDDDEYDPT